MSAWVYSHTQVALWQLCHRKYVEMYAPVERPIEKPSEPMAFSNWLVHKPIENEAMGISHNWELYYANYLAEIGAGDGYDTPIYTIKTAKKILDRWKANPVQGKVSAVEHTHIIELPNHLKYSSRADLMVGNATVDLKMKTCWSRYKGDWPVHRPLSPIDDQLLGQAICADQTYFARWMVYVDKKSGNVSEPFVEDHPVDPQLAERWLQEMTLLTTDMENARVAYNVTKRCLTPKNTANCFAFGRECEFLTKCEFGG